MNNGTTHIIGAGLAGLEAATNLVERGRKVVVYEASAQAGGRCRSYYDAALDMVIDNGNHLLLSGNCAALNYLKRIGTSNAFAAPVEPIFHFADASTNKRWTLNLNRGPLPLWLFNKQRRIPDTHAVDYFSILRLFYSRPNQTIAARLNNNSTLYHNLWHPLLLSALNTHPSIASAKLGGAVVKNSLLKGGDACIPLVAEGLSAVFINPAVQYLSTHQSALHYNRRLQKFSFTDDGADSLEFTSGDFVKLVANDNVIYAASPTNIHSLLPAIKAPDEWRGILNAHFRISPPPNFPKLLGVVNATTEWIFAFPDRLSVTVSDADRLMSEDREILAKRIWAEVSVITGLTTSLPTWQIVKEKRATFASTPAQDAKRPAAKTKWRNIFLAGDWTQTRLPATIEGAVRSGATAADLVMKTT